MQKYLTLSELHLPLRLVVRPLSDCPSLLVLSLFPFWMMMMMMMVMVVMMIMMMPVFIYFLNKQS
jgi:hypothetical protein